VRGFRIKGFGYTSHDGMLLLAQIFGAEIR